MDTYNHIEISKEDVVKKYKFTPYRNAPKPPIRNRNEHGEKLKNELSTSLVTIEHNRHNLGIQSDNLMVIEIESDSMSPNILENMLRKFRIYLLEETAIDNSPFTKLLIQFENKFAIDDFNNERELWKLDEQVDEVLTYAQRRDLFNCIENIRSVSRNDRIGIRLKNFLKNLSEIADSFFIVNIDVWFNGDGLTVIEIENQINRALGTNSSMLLGDLFRLPSLLLGRAKVNEFSLNALLDLDIIASVEMPFTIVSTEPCELNNIDYEPIIYNQLDENAPIATVLDSGIFSGNPLLNKIIVGEEDFDNVENTTSDLNGHGTGVAGIVAYGDFNKGLVNNIFEPLVRICNAKIMHNDNGNSCFAQNKRPEQIIKEAIEYFHKEYNCRVFNLSAGDKDHLYNGGRQFAWAAMLDQLSKNLDIVIIISAGNVSSPIINDFTSRDDLLQKCRNQLFHPEHRLIDPATAALCITVGSITRFDEPESILNRNNRISVGKKDYMSVFTRIGKGINKAVKPEVVDYGGNYALTQLHNNSKWCNNDRNLLEITLHNGNDKIFKRWAGTSFSAPHVTHIAARIERAIEKQLGEIPSANLIKALLINNAKCTKDMTTWAEESTDIFYKGKSNPKQERKLRLCGFGRVDDNILYSNEKQVTLFAEDELPLRSFHIYKIPVPEKFLNVKSDKSIVISLAYNPITHLNRKDYLANNLWFEVFRRIDEDKLLQYKSKKESGEDTEEDLANFPDENKAAFFPGYPDLYKSTLQQRTWKKSKHGGSDLLWNESDPFIYIMVTGKEKFKFAEQELPQSYAIVITFSYSADEDIKLYSKLKNHVRIKERQTTRVRTKI